MDDSKAELLKMYDELGLETFPLTSKKKPRIPWQDREIRTSVETRRKVERSKHIAARVPEGLIVLDFDVGKNEDGTKNQNDPRGLNNLKSVAPEGWDEYIDGAPLQHTPSGGVHILYRTPVDGSLDSVGTGTGGLPPGVDVRANGKGYIGVAPSPGREWDEFSPLVSLKDIPELPEWIATLIRGTRLKKGKGDECGTGGVVGAGGGEGGGEWSIARSNASLGLTAEQAELLYECFDISDFSDYESWINITMAFHHASGGDLEVAALHCAWSSGGAKYHGDDGVMTHWNSFRTDGDNAITHGYILGLFASGLAKGGEACPKWFSELCDNHNTASLATCEFDDEGEVEPTSEPSEDSSSNNWKNRLERRNKKSNPLGTDANIITVLKNAKAFKGALGYNTREHVPYLMNPSPFNMKKEGLPRQLAEDDIHRCIEWFRDTLRMSVGADKLWTIVAQHCGGVGNAQHVKKFDPVHEYFEGLRWDGENRLDSFFHTYCGAEESDYMRSVSLKFFISAAARTYQPGCQVDTMLMISGPQGIGKSQMLRGLVPEPRYYTDRIESITNKDALVQILGKTIVEIAELEAFKKADATALKAFVSCQVDHYRAPYGREAKSYPRTCVFVGTTNADTFLRDVTGSRRFWPVSITKIDYNSVIRDRDQLWAEAVRRYKNGEQWWLTAEEDKVQREVAEEYRERSEWEDIIEKYLRKHYSEIEATVSEAERERFDEQGRRSWTTTGELLTHALHIPIAQQSRLYQMQIGDALRALKWAKKGRRRTSCGIFCPYYPPSDWREKRGLKAVDYICDAFDDIKSSK